MKRGDTFTHAHWLDSNNQPLKCVVTRIAHGVIYYRPIDGGAPMFFSADQASKHVMPGIDSPPATREEVGL